MQKSSLRISCRGISLRSVVNSGHQIDYAACCCSKTGAQRQPGKDNQVFFAVDAILRFQSLPPVGVTREVETPAVEKLERFFRRLDCFDFGINKRRNPSGHGRSLQFWGPPFCFGGLLPSKRPPKFSDSTLSCCTLLDNRKKKARYFGPFLTLPDCSGLCYGGDAGT